MFRIIPLQFISNFSDGELIFFGLIMFMLGYLAVKMRSFVGMGVWALTGITLVGVLQFNLDLVYFWFMAILTFISQAVAMFTLID